MLAALLPAPKAGAAFPVPHYHSARETAAAAALAGPLAVSSSRGPPPYGQRHGFVPRSAGDFGDGGAFPEIHVTQYPLDLGRKDGGSQRSPPCARALGFVAPRIWHGRRSCAQQCGGAVDG